MTIQQIVNRCIAAVLVLAPVITFSVVRAQETDQDSGLIVADGWQDVQRTCTECHSALLITQNSGNKAVWKSRILWMQDTQGLRQLQPAEEETILTYLSTNYGQKEANRRPGLPSHLLPDNPYTLD